MVVGEGLQPIFTYVNKIIYLILFRAEYCNNYLLIKKLSF